MQRYELFMKRQTNGENICAVRINNEKKEAECRLPFLRASCRIRTNDPEITNHVLWPTELKRQTGKRSTSRRYNQVPLLRSSPGGFRGSMPCRTYPGAKVAVFSFLPNNLGIVCGILRISDWHSLDFMRVKECLSFGSLLRK